MATSTATPARWDPWAHGLFWSWNLIFLAFMLLGFVPQLLPELVIGIRAEIIPFAFLAYALLLAAVPLAAILVGFLRLRDRPGRLFALGYVVEGPLMILLAVRLFLIRQGSAGVTLLLAVALLGMAAFLWHLLDRSDVDRAGWTGYLRLAGLTLMLAVSLYAAVWIAFYALPIAGWALRWVGEILRDIPGALRGLWDVLQGMASGTLLSVPFWVLGFLLLMFTATLFVLTPLAMPALAWRAWRQRWRSLVSRDGWLRPASVLVVALAATGWLFVQAARQPQVQAFALLESPPQSVTEARSMLEHEAEIREGLLNAYLAPFRYLSARGEVYHICAIYKDIFGLDSAGAADVQRLYEAVASPLLYTPVQTPDPCTRGNNVALQREPREAAQLYWSFFDQPILEGEHQVVVSAVRSTWSFNQAEEAWRAVDDREVHLARQEVNVQEHGDWAEVELMEVYQNRTAELQEVVYYFNLPESAVLTGVWLGESPERGERFEFQVAPRGAAQAVYREETRRKRDPALLEQIGPRQYRLRIYPVPPLRMAWDADRGRSQLEDAPPMYLWLTYLTLAQPEGWPLPRLAEKRNVFWDADTLRLVNGVPSHATDADWLPAEVPVVFPISAQAHRADLPGGETVLAFPADQLALPDLPEGLRLAVVLDRSRSMASRAGQVATDLERFLEAGGPDVQVEIFLTASEFLGSPPTRTRLAELDPQALVYAGGQNPAQLLGQFEALGGMDQDYDAIFVFTDSDGYTPEADEASVTVPPAPVWIIHLGDEMPLGYDDGTLQAIQASGGGVVGDLDDALTRLAVALREDQGEFPAGAQGRDVLDGYVWMLVPTAQAEPLTRGWRFADEDGFAPLAARRYILAETQRQRETLGEVASLDALHALAVEYGVVTPYSSMIVLVNTEQQRLLDRLSQLSDRFDREVESLGDTVPGSPLPLAGVPEPHEWLLIGLAVALLLWQASRRRLQQPAA